MSGVSEVSRNTPAAAPERAPAEPLRPVEPARPAEAEPTEGEVQTAVATLNRVLEPMAMAMRIRYDEEISGFRVKIVDQRTNEVIREIPSRGVLEAARQAARGLFVDQLS